jgi:3-oxoacyl-[acyl-carrier protein] reductase
MADYGGHFAQVTPLGRVGYPEDIAGAVLYYCSNAADYVTGQVFWVDGGLGLGVGGFANRRDQQPNV